MIRNRLARDIDGEAETGTVANTFCNFSLRGSGQEKELSNDAVVVWFVYLAQHRERVLVWLLNEHYVIRCETLQKEKLTRVYDRKDAHSPLFVLKDMIDHIRDSPEAA